MFDDLVVSGATQQKTHKSWTVVVSTIVQATLLGILILIPLIYTEALPKGWNATFLTAPPPPPPPPPPQPVVHEVKVQPKLIPINKMTAPSVIPKKVEIIKEDVPQFGPSVGVAGGTGSDAGGVLGGLLGAGAAPPPPPKPPARVRIGGAVENASLVRRVDPTYPQIAKMAHQQGTVLLHAVIGKDGSVQELQYISGPAMLMQSAMSAVKQWKYKPLLLNGDPTEVETEISVIFTLNE